MDYNEIMGVSQMVNAIVNITELLKQPLDPQTLESLTLSRAAIAKDVLSMVSREDAASS